MSVVLFRFRALALVMLAVLTTITPTIYYGLREAVVDSIDVLDNNVPFYITWIWHYHQPLYNENGSLIDLLSRSDRPEWLDSVWLNRINIYTGLPADTASQFPGNGSIQVSITGTLIQQLNELEDSGWYDGAFIGWKDRWINALNTYNDAGYPRLTILGTGYYHPIFPLIHRIDLEVFKEQVRMHREAIEENFNVSVDKGFFLIEEAFTPEIIPCILEEGFEWIVVDSEHLFRATKDYNTQYQPEPNRYDVRNSNPDDWEWAVSPTLLFRPHVVEYNGSKIVAFIRYRQVSQWEMNGIDVNTLLNQIMHFQQYNNDPERPFIMVIVHDGENGFPGHNDGQDYYINYIQEFINTIESNPEYSFIKPIGLTQYLEQVYDPRNDTDNPYAVVHVEPGSWETMSTWGEPYYPQWNWPSVSAIDQIRWSLIVETDNLYWTAYNMVEEASLWSEYGDELESAFRDLLMSMTSCYFYWDGDSWWDAKVSVITSRANSVLEDIISSVNGDDDIPPTTMYVWREPYNPYGSVDVYVHVYDYSGLSSLWANVYVNGVHVYSLNLSYTGYGYLYKLHIENLLPGIVKIYVYSVDVYGNTGLEVIRPFYNYGSLFSMDGELDQGVYLVHNSSSNNYVKHLWVSVKEDLLYVATDPAVAGDVFVFISLDPWENYSNAPWVKNGFVAWYDYYLGMEVDNRWTGWFKNYDQLLESEWVGSASGSVLEGYINLTEAYGYVPDTLYITVATYQTQDGGELIEVLVDTNGDNNIDSDEYIEVNTTQVTTPIPEPTHYITATILAVIALTIAVTTKKRKQI